MTSDDPTTDLKNEIDGILDKENKISPDFSDTENTLEAEEEGAENIKEEVESEAQANATNPEIEGEEEEAENIKKLNEVFEQGKQEMNAGLEKDIAAARKEKKRKEALAKKRHQELLNATRSGSPGSSGSTIMKQGINKMADTTLGPAVFFVALGLVDFWFNMNGRGQFEVWIDIALGALAWAVYKNKLILIPLTLELLFPVFGAQFGIANVWPWWAIFGVIIGMYEIGAGEMEMTPGGSFMAIMLIVLTVSTFFPSVLTAGQVLGSETKNDKLEELSQSAKSLGETGWFRTSGVVADITNCIPIPWLGGNDTCDGLQRRIDPTMADVMTSNELTDVPETKAIINIRDSVDDLYFTFEDIIMASEVDLQSGGYPLQGTFSWKIGDYPAQMQKNKFIATKRGDAYVFEGTIRGTWPKNTIPEGEYNAEFTSSYAVVQFAKFRTWLVLYSADMDIDEMDIPNSNSFTESDAMPGPAELSFNLGKRTAPIIIAQGDDVEQHGDQTTLVIKLVDPNAGSSSERLKSINYVRVLADDWFTLDEDYFELSNDKKYWSLSTEKLNIENSRLKTLQRGKGTVIESSVEITPDLFTFADEAVEVNMNIQVAYEYESKRTKNIKVEDRYASGFKYSNVYCPDWKSTTSELIDEKIRCEAYKRNVPLAIAFSVADWESGRNQFKSDGTPMTHDNKDSQGKITSTDMGVYMINDYWNPTLNVNNLLCDYKYNIEQGMKLLQKYFNQCKQWERTLNRYNAGTNTAGECYWSKEAPHDYKTGMTDANTWPYDTTSYSRLVQSRCKTIAKNIEGFSATDCDNCIMNGNCIAPPYPECLPAANNPALQSGPPASEGVEP